MSTVSSTSITAPNVSVQPQTQTPSSTMMPPISAPTSPMVLPTSSGVTLSPQLSASRLQLPPLPSLNLFNMPEPFSWTPTVTLPPPPIHARTPSPARASSSSSSLPAFSGPTWAGNPAVNALQPQSITRPDPATVIVSPLASLASQLSFSTPNVTNIVTTRLAKVEDYLPWRTQFESFLVSHALLGILDGSITAPTASVLDPTGRDIPNPEYSAWLRIDQTVRSWLFATLSRDMLVEVHDIRYSALIWERLETRFMAESIARSIELKRMLNTLKKKESQSMDDYLHEIKNLADSLACINSAVSNRELLTATVQGLGKEYESLITTITLFPDSFTVDSLHPQLLALEQRALYLRSQNIHPGHQAFAATDPAVGPRPAGRGGEQNRGYGGRGFRGGRPRGNRGRGRGYGGQQQGRGGYGGPQQAFAPPPGYYGWQMPPPAPQQPFPPRGQSHNGFPGTVLSNTCRVMANTYALSSCVTNHTFSGFPSVENSFQSPPPPVVCQICFSPGHSALSCSRFVNQNTPALAALPTGESNDSVWYPDSGASAHMTPSEGQPHGSHPPPGLS
ncbi:unnamed protein product [Cuscuta epithymum]|uniref:Retrotransposon gag domain-containing protein n=1 Tax=Cuscuta epithymum TaxID=186058 RepID=A0AAV0F6G6_9ASTE|nr:unnamed protein product [Cuscuta epithymum]